MRLAVEQARAKEQMKKLSSAGELTADVVVFTDREGIIEYVNPAFEAVTGYSYQEVKGKSSNVIKSSKHDKKFYKRLWATIVRGDVFQDVIINRKKSGELYYEEKTITPLKDAKGEITHFISTGKDITERMQTQERLYHLAYHDILTQLPNRGLFVDRLNHALARQRNPTKFLSVLFMDLDRFKIINDTLGHDTGDHLLKMLSQRIIGCLREGDTVARLAGDEFVILLEDITATEDVAPICRKILDSLAQPFQIEGKELFVTGSIGIAMSPVDGNDAGTLIRNADIAMYRAKELGRNNYQFYSADMSVKAFERLNLETSLRHALKRDEFVLYYQPQISPESGRIVGVEALLRWRHHEHGLLLPEQFITLLEETGLIIPVGEWVLRTALGQARAWRDMNFSPIRVSVNLSSRQFDGVCLKKIVMDLMEEIGLDSEWVGLEITESLLMTHEAQTLQTLQEISAAGVQLSIDEFGTGYSSLSYLKRLPIDTLKIDGSFIRAVTTCTASIGTSVDSDAGSRVLQGGVPPFFPRGFFGVLSFSFGGDVRCCSASRDLRSFNSPCNCVTAALHCVMRSSQRRITTSRWFAAVSTSTFACASISSFCLTRTSMAASLPVRASSVPCARRSARSLCSLSACSSTVISMIRSPQTRTLKLAMGVGVTVPTLI